MGVGARRLPGLLPALECFQVNKTYPSVIWRLNRTIKKKKNKPQRDSGLIHFLNKIG